MVLIALVRSLSIRKKCISFGIQADLEHLVFKFLWDGKAHIWGGQVSLIDRGGNFHSLLGGRRIHIEVWRGIRKQNMLTTISI